LLQNQPQVIVFPGTFDPITKGHLDIIERACGLAGKLIIAIAENRDKKPLFSLKERQEMVEAEVQPLIAAGHHIVIKSFTTLLVQFVEAEGARFVVRGLRAVTDFEYEFVMAGMNMRLSPSIETVFLMASDRCQFISSRLIKEIAELGGDVSQFVSPTVEARLKARLRVRP
jgi:pantetheine-phosphate adenylyltransferase